MKASVVEMEGLLRGKCVPAKMLINESLAEYLVRQFDALHERADKAERERDELKQRLANAEHQLHMSELAKFNLRNQRKAQFRKRREVERERDELRLRDCHQCAEILQLAGALNKAVAELARRDAAAGEPVYQVGTDGQWYDCKEYIYQEAKERSDACRILYTTAPPVVLPPKYADELTERAELIEAYSKTQCEIAQELGCDSDNESILKAIYELKALGAQPQKAVELPEEGYAQNFGDLDIVVDLDDVKAALDAANVKWVVKK